MKTLLIGFSCTLLSVFSGCSGTPEVDHGGPTTGAYARKIDQVHMASSRRFLAKGLNEKARQELGQLSVSAQTAAMHLLLAESFLREGNAFSAQEEIVLAAGLEPENGKVNQLEGMIAESRGDWSAAAAAYRLALAKDRSDLDSLLASIRVFHAMGDAARAVELLEHEIAVRPLNFDLSMAAGEAYLSLESYQEAVTYFSTATELHPSEIKARDSLILALSLSGAHREAMERAGSLGADTWSTITQLALGRSSLLLGEGQRAASLFSNYLHQFDAEPAVWMDLARAYYLDKKDSLALSALGRALKLNKQDPAAFTLLGHIRLRSGQQKLAFAAYERAIQAGGDAILLTELMDRAKRARATAEDGEL